MTLVRSCYHRACDSLSNTHPGAFTNLTRAAAALLQSMAQIPNPFSISTTTRNATRTDGGAGL